jgi:predicted unusual protein kinase regulating ubiquinone biosynthesis (AarF/ABC1/UbiB family)
LQIARARGLSVASRYASLAVSVMTITGFAAELDAKLNVMDAAAPALLGYALTGRALGRLHAG